MINPLYLPEIREMLAEDDAQGLAQFSTALHPARTAEFMEGLTAAEAWAVLRHAELALRAEIFGFFDEAKQTEIIATGDRAEIGELIAELPADDRVDLLQRVDHQIVAELLPLIPPAVRRDILRLGSYAAGTAGALMTTEYASLGEGVTVRQALDELGRQAEELETINYLYIVDGEEHLRGVVSTRQLVSSLGRPETTMASLMERDLVTVDVHEDQEQMAERVARYDLLAIPVVDEQRHLLGIITHDDVIDVMRQEASEDVYRLGAVGPLQTGYLETPWFTLSWKRGVWLIFLLLVGLLTALALKTYKGDLERPEMAWMVFFIPLVISAGGNSGAQSATLVIRAISLGDVSVSDALRIVRKELVIGFCLGSVLGLIGYSYVFALTSAGAVSGLVIPITLILVVICGTLIGSLLPLLFNRLGLDPALMSNPFVAGIVDVAGIIIYMNVALLMLGH
jgi:magnesium transporter